MRLDNESIFNCLTFQFFQHHMSTAMADKHEEK